jgi:hypothetical protein
MINNLLSIISPCSNQPGEVWNSAHFSIGCGGLVFFINQWPVGKGHLLLGGFNMIFISLGSSQLFPAKLHFKLIPVGRGLLPFDSHPTFMVGPFRHLIFRRERVTMAGRVAAATATCFSPDPPGFLSALRLVPLMKTIGLIGDIDVFHHTKNYSW